jgi:hypothetical protein
MPASVLEVLHARNMPITTEALRAPILAESNPKAWRPAQVPDEGEVKIVSSITKEDEREVGGEVGVGSRFSTGGVDPTIKGTEGRPGRRDDPTGNTSPTGAAHPAFRS